VNEARASGQWVRPNRICPDKEAAAMRMINKVKNRFAMTAGRAKANYGRTTGSRSLQLKGRWQRIAAAGRQVGEQVKDSGKNIRSALR
jgi:uncharacterized protein YjbJ (UPF0337 family)